MFTGVRKMTRGILCGGIVWGQNTPARVGAGFAKLTPERSPRQLGLYAAFVKWADLVYVAIALFTTAECRLGWRFPLACGDIGYALCGGNISGLAQHLFQHDDAPNSGLPRFNRSHAPLRVSCRRTDRFTWSKKCN
jgi:hypothetical protein